MRARTRRLLLVHDSNAYGGLEIHVLDILKHLDAERYRPLVLTLAYPDPTWCSPEAFTRGVAALGVPILAPRHSLRLADFGADVLRLYRCVTRARPAVVHLHTREPDGLRKFTLAARLARVPVALRTEHQPPSAATNNVPLRGMRPLFDRMTDRILVVSEHCRREQVEALGRDPGKVVSLRQGIEVERFRSMRTPAQARLCLGLDPGTPLVGSVGRLSPEKGQADLVEAASRVRSAIPAQFVLVGSGPLEGELRARVRGLGLEGSFHLVGQRDDPRPWIEALDVAVLPSLSEGCPLSLLEFMAARRPSIVTDWPGVGEVVTSGETGIIVGRHDPGGLAAAILRMLSCPDEAAAMAEAAFEQVRARYDVRRNVAELMDLYDGLLESAGVPA